MSTTSGLAAAIRGSTESDTFDLAGLNPSTIGTNVTGAFKEPFPISSMIRITLVTGAGKLARQKYDENAAKAVTSALRDLGFEDDRGASCINECAGSFKLQHDTGKNLKTVVVFPQITEINEDGTGDDGGPIQQESFLAKGSPEEMIALASTKVFENMMKSRCHSWSQKKGCMSALTSIAEALQGLEGKLLKGQVLSDAEQSFYDQVSISTLEEKQSMLREMMHQQVDEGGITSKEKEQLLSQVAGRLDAFQQEIESAEANNQKKKVENLRNKKEKAETRNTKLSNISAVPPQPLKRQPEIFARRKELAPLLELEDNARGRLMSVKETRSLARKDEILEEIAILEEESRGWFEDDMAFQARVQACNAAWASQSKTSKASKKTGATKSQPRATLKTTAWVTPGSSKAKMNKSTKKTGSKKTGGGGGGVFAAMMMDSDSDSD